jgi:hypothetical protein
MRQILRLAGAIGLLAFATLAALAEDQSAAAYIRSFYPPDDPKAPEARYTPRTAKLWDECRAREEQTGDACMDFDMFVQGNDFELSDIKVEQVSGDAKQAVVRAQFKNFGKDETVIFTLIHGDQGGMIDEIASGCNVLSEHLRGKSTCM